MSNYIELNIDCIQLDRSNPRIANYLEQQKSYRDVFKTKLAGCKKILAVEEITPDSLKDIPYEMLARELIKRMNDFQMSEILYLRTDAEYEGKLNSLKDLIDSVQLVVDEVERR